MNSARLVFTPVMLHVIFSYMSGECSSNKWPALGDNCTCAREGHPTYSLFSLRGTRISGSGFHPNPGYTYTFMPCEPDNWHSRKGNCTNVALCQFDTTGSPHVYRDIGEQRDVLCEATDDYKFALIFPITKPPFKGRTSRVVIECNNSPAAPAELALTSEKNLNFTLKTHCGCPNQCLPPEPTPATTNVGPTSTPIDSNFNWELLILLPSLAGVFVILLCFLCLWWQLAAIREAQWLGCCHCCVGYNDLGDQEERNEHLSENSALLNNQQNRQASAVEHEDPGAEGKINNPVQVEEGDLEEYKFVRQGIKSAVV